MPDFSRRAALRAGAAACTLPLLPARAQEGAALAVAQIIDESPDQHDVSRDFLVGARAAWAAVNADGGVRGQRVQHWVLATQGGRGELRQAWQAALAQPGCVALSGCVGDEVAASVATLAAEAPTLAHVAPWLMRPWQDAQDGVFPIFAGKLPVEISTAAALDAWYRKASAQGDDRARQRILHLEYAEPTTAVAADAGVPGMFIRIADWQPPEIAPI